jgi:hypothetical protein
MSFEPSNGVDAAAADGAGATVVGAICVVASGAGFRCCEHGTDDH